MTADPARTAYGLLRAASQLAGAINDGVVARGFTDVRPAHGFAFVRISRGGATVVDVAEHLGVTKQAASQLVEGLVRRGYVRREPAPGDARARHLVLTDRGWACTRAADDAAAEAVAAWRAAAGARAMDAFDAALGRIVTPGPVRPVW